MSAHDIIFQLSCVYMFTALLFLVNADIVVVSTCIETCINSHYKIFHLNQFFKRMKRKINVTEKRRAIKVGRSLKLYKSIQLKSTLLCIYSQQNGYYIWWVCNQDRLSGNCIWFRGTHPKQCHRVHKILSVL